MPDTVPVHQCGHHSGVAVSKLLVTCCNGRCWLQLCPAGGGVRRDALRRYCQRGTLPCLHAALAVLNKNPLPHRIRSFKNAATQPVLGQWDISSLAPLPLTSSGITDQEPHPSQRAQSK